MQRRIALSLLPLLLGAGCAALGPRDYTISEDRLQAAIERQFPRERRLLEVLDVTLQRPQVRLAPERNRIVTRLELGAAERLSGRTLRGSLALDHGLRFEPSDATVRLANVRVETLQFDVGGTPLQGQAARLGSLLVERMLDDLVLYRVPDDKRDLMRRAGINDATVAVTTRGVELRFVDSR